MTHNPIICAIDTNDINRAKELITTLAESVGAVKLGLEFFMAHGASGVKHVLPEGVPLFLDLKFHDIPNTVYKAIIALKGLPISMLTVHCAGSEEMLKAAVKAAGDIAEPGKPRPLVLGVTVLTSLDEADMEKIGVQLDVAKQVEKLAELARRSGLDGLICSPHEIRPLRKLLARDMLLVVPGIRPEHAEKGDQKRTMTPKEAMEVGADYMVIGRPITEAGDPVVVCKNILQ